MFRRHADTPMELYARVDIPVYAHVRVHDCGCVIAWAVKDEAYRELRGCTTHRGVSQ